MIGSGSLECKRGAAPARTAECLTLRVGVRDRLAVSHHAPWGFAVLQAPSVPEFVKGLLHDRSRSWSGSGCLNRATETTAPEDPTFAYPKTNP